MIRERDLRRSILGAALLVLGMTACEESASEEQGNGGRGGIAGGSPTDAGGGGAATDGPTSPTLSEVGLLSDGGCVIPNPPPSGLPNPAAYDTSIAGLVTDRMTGLMWHRAPSASAMTHANADSYCKNSRVGAYADWRLPTVIELVSLVDYTTVSPAIDTLAFPGTGGTLFWTSTLLAGRPSNAWYVAFAQGNTNFLDVTVANSARCVRAGLANTMCYQGNARFEAANGVVVDASTGLTWQQAIAPASLSWRAAKTYCSGLPGGFRLPSLKELQTIVDYSVAIPGPTIDATVFPGTPPVQFWSSSSLGGSATVAWTVRFNNGDSASSGTTAATDLKQARCVH